MKQHLGLIITGALTVTGIAVDNGLRWRAEMEYRAYDRQTSLLESIMLIQQDSERKAVVAFYLSLDAFSSPIKERMVSYISPVTEPVVEAINEPEPIAEAAAPEDFDPVIEMPLPPPPQEPSESEFPVVTAPRSEPYEPLPVPDFIYGNKELTNGLRSMQERRSFQ